MTTENKPSEIQISFKPDQLEEIEKAKAEFLELVLSVPTPAHDDCPGGILQAKRINLIENLIREGSELKVTFRASSFCARFKTCNRMTGVTFNSDTNKWEGPNANRGIITVVPKVTDSKGTDLMSSLGYKRPANWGQSIPPEEGDSDLSEFKR